MNLNFLKHIPTILALLPQVIEAIKSVEELFSKNEGETREDASRRKQDQAVTLVLNSTVVAEMLSGKEFVDQKKLEKLTRKMIDVIVEWINFIKESR